jgi:hypothetical protein
MTWTQLLIDQKMPGRKSEKKRKHKALGIGAIAEPGVGTLYVRGPWMKKMNELGKHKQRQAYRSRRGQKSKP